MVHGGLLAHPKSRDQDMQRADQLTQHPTHTHTRTQTREGLTEFSTHGGCFTNLVERWSRYSPTAVRKVNLGTGRGS